MKRALAAMITPPLLLLGACRHAPLYRVVHIDGPPADSSERLFGAYPFFSAPAPVLWLGHGSWVFPVGDDDGFLAPYVYQTTDGDRVSLDFMQWGTTLAGRVVSLNLAEDSAVAWLGQAPPSDLARLRFVLVGGGSLEDSRRAALTRLAAVNPYVGLGFDSAEIDLTLPHFLARFRPRLLLLPYNQGSPHLAQQLQVEDLWISVDDSDDLEVLDNLPNLRRLVVAGSLTPSQAAQIPKRLDELLVFGDDDPGAADGLDPQALRQMPRLQTLVLGEKLLGHPALANMPKLRHIAFTDVTQAQFAAIVQAHPDLESVGLLLGNVTDLAPLRGLRRLRAVSVAWGSRHLDVDVIREIKSLEYVVAEASSEQVAAIQTALPSAVVVKVEPFCLGSAWILLLVPFVAAIARRRRAVSPA